MQLVMSAFAPTLARLRPGQLTSRICPSRPRTRRGTSLYAPGGSSGRRVSARTWTTLCCTRPPDSCTQDTQAHQEPSASTFSQHSRCPVTPTDSSTSGGAHGGGTLAISQVCEILFDFARFELRFSSLKENPRG